MAMSINEIKRERQSAYRQVKRMIQAADTNLEKLQRQVQRILDRKLKMPEMRDFQETLVLLEATNQALNVVYIYTEDTIIPYFENL